MKLGLYSITYLGLWYRGEALPLPAMITRAKQYGYDGIEIDGKRPHGNPLDLPTASCHELRRRATDAGRTARRARLLQGARRRSPGGHARRSQGAGAMLGPLRAWAAGWYTGDRAGADVSARRSRGARAR